MVLAAASGDYTAVDQLLEDGADVGAYIIPPLRRFNNGKLEAPFEGSSGRNGLNYFARTALQAAAECGHEEMVALLIKSGPVPTQIRQSGLE